MDVQTLVRETLAEQREQLARPTGDAAAAIGTARARTRRRAVGVAGLTAVLALVAGLQLFDGPVRDDVVIGPGPSAAPAGWLGSLEPGQAEPIPAAPIVGRSGHVAAWTGQELIAWAGTTPLTDQDLSGGGSRGGAVKLLDDGAAFDPSTGRWRTLADSPLSPRTGAHGLWTGRELLVVGGRDLSQQPLADLAAYDPASDSWRMLPDLPFPVRAGLSAVWTGDELVVLGGITAGPDPQTEEQAQSRTIDLSGAALDPDTGTWRELPAPDLPPAYEAGVVAGDGQVYALASLADDEQHAVVGAVLDPAAGTWRDLPESPLAKGWQVDGIPVWTGDRLLVLSPFGERIDGGETNPWPVSLTTAAAYDPTTDAWVELTLNDLSTSASGPGVWTGQLVVFWGPGWDPSVPDAVAYDPAADAWHYLAPAPEEFREARTVVWTGQAVLAWGGNRSYEGFDPANDGTAFIPQPTSGAEGGPDAQDEALEQQLARLRAQESALESQVRALSEQAAGAYQRLEAGDEDAEQALRQIGAQLEEVTQMLIDLRSQIYALQQRLAEREQRPHPVDQAKNAATDTDRELIRSLIAFANDPSQTTADKLPLADTVWLGLADELIVQRTADELVDPEAWLLDVELHRAHTGPFSALRALDRSGEVQVLAGPHPHCASDPVPAPAAVVAHRRVSVQPATTDSCLQWWTVDLFLDTQGRIAAITHDFWEP